MAIVDMNASQTEASQLDIRELTCIVCPVGCGLKARLEHGKVVEVEGNGCKRGAQYAMDELCAPKRTVTSTVRVAGGFLPLVPVRTENAIPKEKISEALSIIAVTVVQAPVEMHQVIVENVAGTGVNVISSRTMPKAKEH